MRDHAAVRVVPPLVPLAAIFAGVGLESVWPLAAGFELPPWIRYGMGGAIAAGSILGFGLPAVVRFRRSGQNENPFKPTPSIVESGPYRFTRNPMYVQMLLFCAGVAIILQNPWIALLIPVAGWVLQRWAILPEEAYLERKFGDAYLDYKHRVRRWF